VSKKLPSNGRLGCNSRWCSPRHRVQTSSGAMRVERPDPDALSGAVTPRRSLHAFTRWCCGTGMMEAASTSETSVSFYQTSRRYNPGDSHLHNRCRENLKSYITLIYFTWRLSLICKTYTLFNVGKGRFSDEGTNTVSCAVHFWIYATKCISYS
jgi:hypothetical protein